MPRHRKKIIDIGSAIVILSLVALDVTVWRDIFIFLSDASASFTPSIDFLPVTQGAPALLVLPGGITVLTDAGSDATIVDDLQKVLPPGEGAYIDLAIISSPQSANYEGYQYLLEHYQVGAFLYNGRADGAYPTQWQQLMDVIVAKHIPLITVGAGDRIRCGANEIEILSPDATFARSPDSNDTAIVQRISAPQLKVLLAADIGVNVESTLVSRIVTDMHNGDLRTEILQASFPAIGTPMSDTFLRAVAPRTIIAEPGVKGTPSAPTKAMLAHLASSTDASVVIAGHSQFLLYNK